MDKLTEDMLFNLVGLYITIGFICGFARVFWHADSTKKNGGVSFLFALKSTIGWPYYIWRIVRYKPKN